MLQARRKCKLERNIQSCVNKCNLNSSRPYFLKSCFLLDYEPMRLLLLLSVCIQFFSLHWTFKIQRLVQMCTSLHNIEWGSKLSADSCPHVNHQIFLFIFCESSKTYRWSACIKLLHIFIFITASRRINIRQERIILFLLPKYSFYEFSAASKVATLTKDAKDRFWATIIWFLGFIWI